LLKEPFDFVLSGLFVESPQVQRLQGSSNGHCARRALWGYLGRDRDATGANQFEAPKLESLRGVYNGNCPDP